MDSQLAEQINSLGNRFWGKYRAQVVDNQDPKNMGRLKLKIPAVFGAEEVSGWAMPCVPYAGVGLGFAMIPEVDALVWAEFEAGNPSFPIWAGGFWAAPDNSSEMPEEVKGKEPTVKIVATSSGHKIILDDEDGAAKIEITDASGNQLLLNKDGITVVDVSGNEAVMDSSGMKLTDSSGNELEFASSAVKLKAAANLELEGVQIKIGGAGAVEPAVLGQSLLTWLSTHTHTGNLGAPTTPPMVPPLPNLLSTVVKVK